MSADRVFLASFRAQVRGIKFYDVSTDSINVGDSVECRLEPANPYDNNCVAVWITAKLRRKQLGHLEREVSHVLAPLLRQGQELVALGNVISLPYSRHPTSRWHGYRVCDVTVVIEGPSCWLEKVKNVLGGQDNFTTINDEWYNGDEESDTNIDKNPPDSADDNTHASDINCSQADNTAYTCDDTTPKVHPQLSPLRTPSKRPRTPSETDSDATPLIDPAEIIRQICNTTPLVVVTAFKRQKKRPKKLFTE